MNGEWEEKEINDWWVHKVEGSPFQMQVCKITIENTIMGTGYGKCYIGIVFKGQARLYWDYFKTPEEARSTLEFACTRAMKGKEAVTKAEIVEGDVDINKPEPVGRRLRIRRNQ